MLRRYRVKMTTPIEQLSDEVLDVILYGTDREQTFAYTSRGGKTWEYRASFEGVVNNLQRRYSETSSDYVKEEIEKYMSASTCPACKGARLKPEALAVTIGGRERRRADAHVDRAARAVLSRADADAAARADRASDRQGDPRAPRVS